MSLLISVAFAAGAVFIYSDLIQPLYKDLEIMRGQRADKEAAVKAEENIKQEFDNRLKTLDEKKIALVSEVFPKTPRADAILEQLQGISEISKVQLQSVSIATPAIEQTKDNKSVASLVRPMMTLVISVKYTGPYANVKEFVRTLESSIRLFEVRDVTVQPASKSDTDLFSVDLKAVAFYQSDASATAPQKE